MIQNPYLPHIYNHMYKLLHAWKYNTSLVSVFNKGHLCGYFPYNGDLLYSVDSSCLKLSGFADKHPYFWPQWHFY